MTVVRFRGALLFFLFNASLSSILQIVKDDILETLTVNNLKGYILNKILQHMRLTVALSLIVNENLIALNEISH